MMVIMILPAISVLLTGLGCLTVMVEAFKLQNEWQDVMKIQLLHQSINIAFVNQSIPTAMNCNHPEPNEFIMKENSTAQEKFYKCESSGELKVEIIDKKIKGDD